MKTKKHLSLLLAVLLMFSLTACGVAQEDFDALQSQNTQVEASLSNVQSELEEVQGRLAELEAQNSALEKESAKKENEISRLESENESLNSEVSKAEAQLKEKQLTEAKPVIDAIAAIGEITLEKESSISAARSSYDALPESSRGHVSNYELLTSAEKELSQQKSAEAERAEAERLAAEAEAQQNTGGGEVLITRTGSKYHSYKCGNGTYFPTTLADAQGRGLSPCKKCF